MFSSHVTIGLHHKYNIEDTRYNLSFVVILSFNITAFLHRNCYTTKIDVIVKTVSEMEELNIQGHPSICDVDAYYSAKCIIHLLPE